LHQWKLDVLIGFMLEVVCIFYTCILC